MGLFDFFSKPDINEGVRRFAQTPGAILLDVRTPEEYRAGHIPGSRNLPLQTLESIETLIPEREAPLFVYCRSGSRSSRAVAILRQMGYMQAEDIGGIIAYTGRVERE